jgi:ammonia channel protein AmtB
VIANASVNFVLAYGFFRLVQRVHGNRVSADVELAGLDAIEMGTDAYYSG